MESKKMEDKIMKILEEKAECAVTTLLTDKGNYYIICCNALQDRGEKTEDDYSGLEDMVKTGDTKVSKMLTILKSANGVTGDIPCVWLRRRGYDMNHDNLDAAVGSGNTLYLKNLF